MLLLDLDGTIADTLPHVFEAYRHAVAPWVERAPTDAEIEATFGPSERECLAVMAPAAVLVTPQWSASIPTTSRHHAQLPVKLVAGIVEVIDLARSLGWRVGVFTGKGRRAAIFSLTELGVWDRIEHLVSGSDVTRPKPDPEGVFLASKALAVPVDRILLAGDSPADVQAGKAAGCSTAAVLWAAFRPERLRAAGADFVCERVEDLAAAVLIALERCWLKCCSHGTGGPEAYEQSQAGHAASLFAVAMLAFAGLAGPMRSRRCADPGDKSSDKVFVGYLYGQPRGVNFRLYTHLCHAFLVADGDGSLRKSKTVPSRELTSSAHKAGVRVLLSLGGWGWDRQFASIVSEPEAEERYVKSVLAIVDEYDYDGIDLDWEYPDNKQEVVGFERLARRLRKEIDTVGTTKGRPMVLTMAASSNAGTLKWLDKDFLLETMDWLNIMTYDFTGDWTNYAGHHSPLFASSKQPGGNPRSTELTMKYLLEERALPASRLAVGVPLYGRGFAVSEPYQSTKGVARTRLPQGNYSNLHKLLQEQGWTRLWDDETKNPWLLKPDRSMVIGYDDAESVALKTDWAVKQGFRGVFFWQVAADRLPDGSNPLQEASRKVWDANPRRSDKEP